MPSYDSGNLIKAMRERRQWTQSRVLSGNILSTKNLSRIENQHQSPSPESFRLTMDSLQMPIETFFCPYLENQSTEIIQMREAALYYLSFAHEHPQLIEKLEHLLIEMEESGFFNNGINRQFLLSCKASMFEILKKEPSETLSLIKEGLAITFPEYDENTFEDEMLLFEEVRLLHTKALVYRGVDEEIKAIKLLERIVKGLYKTPMDNRDKDNMAAPILLTLTQCYIQSENYREAFKTCRKGYAVSIKNNRGLHAPDFAFHMACCLQSLGYTKIAATLIKQAYFGYTMLRKYNAASNVLKYAHEGLGVRFETYNVESLSHRIPEPNLSHGKTVKCNSIGGLINAFRCEAKLTLGEISKGICSTSNLSKIEAGKIQGSVYHLEAIVQRLGRHIDRYFDTFLSSKDFADKQMRDEINNRLAIRKYQEAEELLLELCSRKAYKSGVCKQFIDLANAELCYHKEDFSVKHLDLLRKTLSFNDSELEFGIVARTRLTYYEIIAINQIAINLCESNSLNLGLRLFEDLKMSMDRFIVDEAEKLRMYICVLYNYSKYLAHAKRYEDALDIVELGEDLSVKHDQLEYLPSLTLNRACDVLEIDGKKESIPYFAQAYYGLMLVGRFEGVKRTRDFVADRLGINFD